MTDRAAPKEHFTTMDALLIATVCAVILAVGCLAWVGLIHLIAGCPQ